MMEKTYKLVIPDGFDQVAKTSWRLMESSHELFEYDDHLVVVDDSCDFDDPTWEGKTFKELELWLIRCFQEWVSTGPVANPMWQPICECLQGGKR